MTRKRRALVLFAAGVLAIPQTPGQTSNSEYEDVVDPLAVSFGQVSFGEPLTPEPNSQVGVAMVDFRELKSLGLTGGYLQILGCESVDAVNCEWVVQNLPILDPSVESGTTVTFGFRTNFGKRNDMYFVVLASKPNPAGGKPKPPIKGPPNMNGRIRQRRRLAPVAKNIGGVFIPPPPALPGPIMPVFPGKNDAQPTMLPNISDSVETAFNQCAEAAVANSLQYLEDNFGAAKVPVTQATMTDNTPGAFGNPARSRVGQLDLDMGRVARDPLTGKPAGTPTLNFLDGKMKFLMRGNLNQKLVVKSQGRFCDRNNQNCKNGSDGMVPTADFIKKELDDMEDVEICFAWAGPPAGAHCVMATGYQIINGFLDIHFAHDSDQNDPNKGTGDPEGHGVLDVGVSGGALRVRNFRSAVITHVITESPK